jgi:hypothetical protein
MFLISTHPPLVSWVEVSKVIVMFEPAKVNNPPLSAWLNWWFAVRIVTLCAARPVSPLSP